MHCVKLLGQRPMARDFDRQVAEFQVRVAATPRSQSPSRRSWDKSVREKGQSDRQPICATESLHGLQRNTRLERRIVIPSFRHVLISSCLEISRLQIVASVTDRISGGSSIHFRTKNRSLQQEQK
jgi:hypothetical protein